MPLVTPQTSQLFNYNVAPAKNNTALMLKLVEYKDQKYKESYKELQSLYNGAMNLNFLNKGAQGRAQAHNNKINDFFTKQGRHLGDITRGDVMNQYMDIFNGIANDKELFQDYQVDKQVRSSLQEFQKIRNAKDPAKAGYGEKNAAVFMSELNNYTNADLRDDEFMAGFQNPRYVNYTDHYGSMSELQKDIEEIEIMEIVPDKDGGLGAMKYSGKGKTRKSINSAFDNYIGGAGAEQLRIDAKYALLQRGNDPQFVNAIIKDYNSNNAQMLSSLDSQIKSAEKAIAASTNPSLTQGYQEQLSNLKKQANRLSSTSMMDVNKFSSLSSSQKQAIVGNSLKGMMRDGMADTFANFRLNKEHIVNEVAAKAMDIRLRKTQMMNVQNRHLDNMAFKERDFRLKESALDLKAREEYGLEMVNGEYVPTQQSGAAGSVIATLFNGIPEVASIQDVMQGSSDLGFKQQATALVDSQNVAWKAENAVKALDSGEVDPNAFMMGSTRIKDSIAETTWMESVGNFFRGALKTPTTISPGRRVEAIAETVDKANKKPNPFLSDLIPNMNPDEMRITLGNNSYKHPIIDNPALSEDVKLKAKQSRDQNLGDYVIGRDGEQVPYTAEMEVQAKQNVNSEWTKFMNDIKDNKELVQYFTGSDAPLLNINQLTNQQQSTFNFAVRSPFSNMSAAEQGAFKRRFNDLVQETNLLKNLTPHKSQKIPTKEVMKHMLVNDGMSVPGLSAEFDNTPDFLNMREVARQHLMQGMNYDRIEDITDEQADIFLQQAKQLQADPLSPGAKQSVRNKQIMARNKKLTNHMDDRLTRQENIDRVADFIQNNGGYEMVERKIYSFDKSLYKGAAAKHKMEGARTYAMRMAYQSMAPLDSEKELDRSLRSGNLIPLNNNSIDLANVTQAMAGEDGYLKIHISPEALEETGYMYQMYPPGGEPVNKVLDINNPFIEVFSPALQTVSPLDAMDRSLPLIPNSFHDLTRKTKSGRDIRIRYSYISPQETRVVFMDEMGNNIMGQEVTFAGGADKRSIEARIDEVIPDIEKTLTSNGQ